MNENELRQKQLKVIGKNLETLRDNFRNWCAEVPVSVLAGDRQVQKLIMDYERHLSLAIEALSLKGL